MFLDLQRFFWTGLENYYICGMKVKKKTNSGSLKIDPIVYDRLANYCKKELLRLNAFASKLLENAINEIEIKQLKD